MRKETERLAEELQRETVSLETVRRGLQHPAALIRANAIWALGRLAARDTSLLPELKRSFEDPKNQVSLMGGVKVAHLAVEVLVRVGTSEALDVASSLMENAGSDRQAIAWHLQSEGLELRES